MPCKYCQWDECTYEMNENEDYATCAECPHYVEADDPYLEMIRNEDARIKESA